MALITDAGVHTTAAPERKCGPKVGTAHNDPAWVAAVGLLRMAVKAARQHAHDRGIGGAGEYHVTEDLFDHGHQIDPAGLHVLHLVMKMVWTLNNNAAARRNGNGAGAA